MSWKGSWGAGQQQSAWGSQQKDKGSWGSSQQPSWSSKGGKGGSSQGTIAPWKPPAGSTSSPGIKPQQPLLAGKGTITAKGATGAASVAALKAKITKMTSDLESAEKQANSTLEIAKKSLENEKSTPLALKTSADSVERHKTKLVEMQTALTKDRDEARKAGPSGSACIADISKLLEKATKAIQQVTIVLNKLKAKSAKAQQEKEMKDKEAKDNATFKPVLMKLTKDIAIAEENVNAVAKKAAPIIANKPEGEELDKAIEAIEKAAAEAMKKVTAAKNDLNEKSKGIVGYAPEAKKAAQASLTELQKKMTDSGRKVAAYQAFKRELPKIIASQQAIKEVSDKFEGHDKPITNATKLGDMSKLDKEKIDAIDNLLEPVKKAIKEATALIYQKSPKADATTQATFTELKKKGEEMTKKIEAVYTKIKKQRDVIRSEGFVDIATEKLDKAEEAWKGCQEAEMPFLTGVEVLPGEQNDEALKACAEAIAATNSAVGDARSYVKSTLAEVKSMEKDLSEKLTPLLTPFNAKIQTIEASLSKFKKEHAERKVIAIMQGALESVDALELKMADVETQTKAMAAEGLEDATVEAINEAIEKGKGVLGDATTSMAETKKVFSEKQKEAKAPHNDPASTNINGRLNAAQEKINKLRNSIQFADKLVRAKKAITEGEEKMKETEKAVEKVKTFEGSTFTEDSVKAFTEAHTTAVNAIRTVGQLVERNARDAPPKAKEVLQGLVQQKVEAQKTIDKIKADTKDAREEVLVDVYLAAAEVSTKAVENAADQMEIAEKPFVVGGDMPLAESLEAIKKCEEAATAVKKASSEANNLIRDKTQAVKPYGEAAAKKAKEGFGSMTDRVKAVGTKLTAFEKDLKDRAKSTKMSEATSKVEEIETLLKKTLDAGEPFTKEGAAEMSEADAEAPLKAFMDSDKELSKSITAARSFISARLGEQKGNKENTDTLKKFQERLSKVSEELAPVKKAIKPHEQKALGKIMLAEAKEQVEGLPAEIKKATDACAPLLEKGGAEFLVDASIRSLIKALLAAMKAKELTQEKMFEDVAQGKPATEAAFVAYLKALPEAISHDELSAFSDERRVEIFKSLSTDGKSVTLDNFLGMFTTTQQCVKPVTLTDKFESEGSETLCKVEPGTDVTVIGTTKEDAAGLVRSEAKVGDQKGWITIFQKKGAQFLKKAPGRLAGFYDASSKALADAQQAVQKVSSSVASKSKGAPGDEAPMKASREEIAKLKEKVTEAQKSLNELKQKYETARKDYKVKEQSEANAHIEARNLKEAAPFMEGPQAKLELVLAAEKTAEEAVAPLISLTGDELLAFATPASVLEAIEKAAATVTEKATELKEALKEQMKAASDVNPQTGGTGEAKKQLKLMQTKMDSAERNAKKMLATVKTKCGAIVNPKLDETSVVIRKYSQKNGLSGDALFDKFKEGDKVTESGFCKLLKSVEDVSVSDEVARLISQKLGKDGISKDAFLNYVVTYYKVTKTIAFTDSVDISQCKTLRKAAIGEIIEMLEGPVKDETSGITRIRAKALKEPICEGWVTLAGNQGSEFLEKAKKP